jgi:hypothetical protein
MQKRERVKLSKHDLATLYKKIDARDGLRCAHTGLQVLERADHHHRQFKSRGGSDVASNLITLYGPGNTQGSHGWAHKTREAELLGFSIPSWIDDTEKVPIKILHPYNGLFWAILFNDLTMGFMTKRDGDDRMRELGIWRDGESA